MMAFLDSLTERDSDGKVMLRIAQAILAVVALLFVWVVVLSFVQHGQGAAIQRQADAARLQAAQAKAQARLQCVRTQQVAPDLAGFLTVFKRRRELDATLQALGLTRASDPDRWRGFSGEFLRIYRATQRHCG